MMPEAMLASGEKMPVDETAAAKDNGMSTEEQQPIELILTLKNKKQIPFSKLAKAKRGGKGTLKKNIITKAGGVQYVALDCSGCGGCSACGSH